MSESEAQRRLHEIFQPLVVPGVRLVHGVLKPLILEKQRHGWRSEFTRRLERAFDRFVDRMEGDFAGLKTQAREALQLVLVLSDLERQWFPRHCEILIEELVAEGIIYFDEQEKKIKVM